MREEILEPNWINTADYFANGLAEHQWEKFYLGASIQLMEITRHLQNIDPKGLEALLTRLRRKQHRRTADDAIYVKYCDAYDSVTKTCPHIRPPRPVVEGVTVITADGTSTGDLMEDDSIRIREGG